MTQIHHNPEIIRAWRVAGGLSQAQLAAEISVSRPTIARTETAGTRVSLGVIAAICKRFRKPMAAALNEEGLRRFGSAARAAH